MRDLILTCRNVDVPYGNGRNVGKSQKLLKKILFYFLEQNIPLSDMLRTSRKFPCAAVLFVAAGIIKSPLE